MLERMDALDNTRLVRRLLWWNRFFLALVLLAALLAGARWKIDELGASIRELRITWQADGSIFLSAADGPLVVTHLALPADYPGGVRATALLPRSLPVIDSGGVGLSKAEVSRLAWLDKRGQKMQGPTPGAPLSALYFEPKVALWR